jgi:putative FmdB family regulatory protein
MPLYEYECEACGNRFEVIQKFSDPPADVCRVCGKGPVQRLVSSPAIQFKGSGWYITDYARKGGGGDSPPAKSGDSGSSDAKTEGAAKADSGAKSDTSSKKESSTPASSGSTSKE